MSDINSQIAERIKELQEQNEARAKEQEAAEKAVAEGNFESKPVVEQVKKKNKNKIKKKSVSVKASDLAKEEKDDNIPSTGDMAKEDIHEEDASPGKEKKPDRSRLDNAFSKMQTLTDIDMPKEEVGERDTKSVPKVEIEKAKDEEDEKPKSSKERGHHAKVSRIVRYVDQDGKAISTFCLIDIETGEVYSIKDKSTIGRAPDMDIVIQNRHISGRHAIIYKEGRDYFIEDIGSTNGTKVNDEKINEKTKITPGDKIRLAAKDFIFDAEN